MLLANFHPSCPPLLSRTCRASKSRTHRRLISKNATRNLPEPPPTWAQLFQVISCALLPGWGVISARESGIFFLGGGALRGGHLGGAPRKRLRPKRGDQGSPVFRLCGGEERVPPRGDLSAGEWFWAVGGGRGAEKRASSTRRSVGWARPLGFWS